ncbi:MAG: hypothetical protein ACYTCV_05390 [Planctomycetota bacterium]|jgi:hypothetical protein
MEKTKPCLILNLPANKYICFPAARKSSPQLPPFYKTHPFLSTIFPKNGPFSKNRRPIGENGVIRDFSFFYHEGTCRDGRRNTKISYLFSPFVALHFFVVNIYPVNPVEKSSIDNFRKSKRPAVPQGIVTS